MVGSLVWMMYCAGMLHAIAKYCDSLQKRMHKKTGSAGFFIA
jgi:hypothetical protein